MSLAKAVHRAVTQLMRHAAPNFENAARRIETDLADLDFDRPDEAFAALRRVVAESRAGEQLAPAPRTPPHRRHLEGGVGAALAVYSRH